MNAFRREEGQTVVLSLVFMTVLLSMAAFVLDVGSWYRAQRAVQATADAAALAGAQELPHNPGGGASLAASYAAKNGGGLAETSLSGSNDTIRVRVDRPTPGFFAHLFGIESVRVDAVAAAKAAGISEARYVAPIAVDDDHPMLKCPGEPCFNQETELTLLNLHNPGSGTAAGSFGLIDLELGGEGHPGASTLGAWILRGFDQYMPLGDYAAATGTEFNSTHVQNALQLRFGEEMLFPVYRTLKGSGQNAEFDVIGWVGFVVTSKSLSGSSGKLRGYFTRVIWDGIQGHTGHPTYGVRAVTLVE